MINKASNPNLQSRFRYYLWDKTLLSTDTVLVNGSKIVNAL